MIRRSAILVFVATATTGCLRSDANMILGYTAAAFNGGYEVALLNERVWAPEQSCDEITFEDNEVWVVWSHVARPQEFGDTFLVSERLVRDRAFIAAADDGIHVYFAFEDFAEVADRYGTTVVELGAGMGAGDFHGSKNLLVAEGPDSLVLVTVNEQIVEDLAVDGSSPSFSPDGRRITYGREGVVYAFDLTEGDESLLGEGIGPRYTADGGILALRDGEEGRGIYRLAEDSSTWEWLGVPDEQVFDGDFDGAFDGESYDSWWRLAPDGRRVLHSPKPGKFVLQDWSGSGDGDWAMTSDLVCD